MMTRFFLVLTLSLTFFLAGCTSVRTGPELRQKHWRWDGKFGMYMSYTDLRKYDGNMVQMDFINAEQQGGEVFNFDLWPLGGFGLGPIGARGHLGPIGGGVGSMWYIPSSVGKGTINSDKDLHFKIE